MHRLWGLNPPLPAQFDRVISDGNISKRLLREREYVDQGNRCICPWSRAWLMR